MEKIHYQEGKEEEINEKLEKIRNQENISDRELTETEKEINVLVKTRMHDFLEKHNLTQLTDDLLSNNIIIEKEKLNSDYFVAGRYDIFSKKISLFFC